jgi:hypothetical protein
MGSFQSAHETFSNSVEDSEKVYPWGNQDGWNRVDSITKASVKQEGEYDLDIQWRSQMKVLKGFWLRTRYANIAQREGRPTPSDFRIILDYDLPLL